MMHGVLRIVILLFGFLALQVRAVEVEPNQVYPGGTVIEMSQSGVRFTLPAQLVAVASEQPQQELTAGLMPQAASGDNTLYIQVGQGDLEAIAAEMAAAVSFKGETLHPTATPTRLKGGIVHNDFELEGGFKAFMLAAVADNDTAVIFLAVAREAAIAAYREAVAAIVNSLTITIDEPASRAAASAPPKAGTAARKPSPALSEIVGAWMRRSNYSNGIYIENTQKWVFSANGRVAWGSGSIIAGGTGSVSLRGGGDNPPDYGRWKIRGDRLTIDWDDGTQGNWTYLVFDYEGQPILVLKSGGSTYRYRKID